jgi:hypothetical protein
MALPTRQPVATIRLKPRQAARFQREAVANSVELLLTRFGGDAAAMLAAITNYCAEREAKSDPGKE